MTRQATDSQTPGLTDPEADAICRKIAPQVERYVSRYDEKKYPPAAYDAVCGAFKAPTSVTREDIERALVWKFGHAGKANYPRAHRDLIQAIYDGWPAFLRAPRESAVDIARYWQERLARPKATITIAFLIHLLLRDDFPILDQHNFRAANHLMAEVRPGWQQRRAPSGLQDLYMIRDFMAKVGSAWPVTNPVRRPTERELDKFLMMYGKDLKKAHAVV